MSTPPLEKLQYLSEITLEDIPKQWIPNFELYYPDLPQFPTVYVHFTNNHKRVYGFPVCISFIVSTEKTFRAKINFLCNIDLNKDESSKKAAKNELEERFGLKDKIGLQDITGCCNGSVTYENFFKDLWQHVSLAFGDYIPYGKFYEEIYSIVRFVSAWQPKTGRQSEMRMLYNFISVFGEELEIHHDWGYLQFYLMPTYDDILNNKLDNFPKFKRLNSSMERIWDIAFQKEIMIDGKIIKSMEKSWPQAKDDFIEKVTLPLYTKKKITLDQKYDLERLVDSFNRHSWRAAFFIWNIMNIKIHDYRKWNKDFFVKFYLNKKKKVGYSEKVIACFLQQGFKNVDVIPIDTWVESFHKGPLGIFDKADFFKPFSCLGKLERVIWLSSQANKTNMKSFFNLLWCQRYGDTGNNELRRANPIACYECFLKKTCIGMSKIMDLNVLVKDGKTLKIKDLLVAKSGKIKGRILNLKNIATKKVVLQAEKNNCDFICLTINSVPKKIFICKDKSKHIWKLIDEFSGYILKSEKTGTVGKIVTTNELLDSLPPFQK